MISAEISPVKVREQLGLSQSELARVLGTHEMTISKWERGELQPGSYKRGLLDTFAAAARIDVHVGAAVREQLHTRGALAALHTLLCRVYV